MCFEKGKSRNFAAIELRRSDSISSLLQATIDRNRKRYILYGTGNKHRRPSEQAEDRVQQD